MDLNVWRATGDFRPGEADRPPARGKIEYPSTPPLQVLPNSLFRDYMQSTDETSS